MESFLTIQGCTPGGVDGIVFLDRQFGRSDMVGSPKVPEVLHW